MTNQIEKRLEIIAEEVEQLQKSKLFNAAETKLMLAKRKAFEHNIQAPTRTVKNFTDYISYEKNLLKDIAKRRGKCKKDKKKGNVEHRIIKRVKLLYEVGLKLFSDCPLLSAYLRFCKKVNYTTAGTDAVTNMLKTQPENPQVWCIAAKWYAYDCDDTNKALALLSKGIARHKDSQILYKETIHIELFEYDKPGLPKENSPQEIYSKRIKKIVNTTFEKINDCNFYIEVLEFLEKYPFTKDIQETITEHLTNNYSDNENLWDALAQRERTGPVCKTEAVNSTDKEVTSTENAESTSTTNATTKRTPKARLLACFEKYRQGLTALPPAKKCKLWTLYIDFLLKLNQEGGAATELKLSTLKAALKEASEEDCLLEKHYIAWLKLLPRTEALAIAEKGTISVPDSVDLWKTRLRLQMLKDTKTEVDQVFKLGVNALKEKALPLWLSILQYHIITSTDDYIDLIYKDAIKQPHEISNRLKSRYLEWLALTKGTDAAREVYGKLAEERPYCKDLHSVMAKLETIEMDNYENWDKVYRLACEQFGKEDLNVWINRIRFYVIYNKEIPNLDEQVQIIRKQAIKSIPQESRYIFASKYRKLMKACKANEKKKS